MDKKAYISKTEPLCSG